MTTQRRRTAAPAALLAARRLEPPTGGASLRETAVRPWPDGVREGTRRGDGAHRLGRRGWIRFPNLVGVAGLAVIVASGPSSVTAQEAGPGDEPAPVAPVRAEDPEGPPAGLYAGPASCAQDACHGSTRPRDVFAVDQNEYYVWLNRDRHARAYDVLFDERSRAIARNLDLDRPAHEARACLTCHTLAAPEEERSGTIEATDGVSCEACHGPASGWRGGHTAEDWDRADMVAAGMTDLADPAVRGRVCLGCHLGTGGGGEVDGGSPGGPRAVDHDLIAAGHPALRFELDNYSQRMPAHWRREPGNGVRAWAVGQAVAFRLGLLELARRAGEGSWPDLSFLDCRSCHHSLAEERYRRGLAGTYSARIGMPPWSPARWSVLRLLVARHAPDELGAIESAVRRLARRVSGLSTPPAEVAAEAEALARRVEPLVERLRGVEWTVREARAVLLAVTAERDALSRADVASAEQTVQALYSLAGYLLEERPALVNADVVDGLAALAGEVEDPEAFDPPRFRAALARVEEGLR